MRRVSPHEDVGELEIDTPNSHLERFAILNQLGSKADKVVIRIVLNLEIRYFPQEKKDYEEITSHQPNPKGNKSF